MLKIQNEKVVNEEYPDSPDEDMIELKPCNLLKVKTNIKKENS